MSGEEKTSPTQLIATLIIKNLETKMNLPFGLDLGFDTKKLQRLAVRLLWQLSESFPRFSQSEASLLLSNSQFLI